MAHNKMFHWVKTTVGITDHHYGPEAVHSVAEQAKEIPYTETTKADLVWETIDGTNVETKTFYVVTDSGKIASLQVIYSNLMGIRTTSQFNSKIFSQEPGKPHLWASDNLKDFHFSKDMQNFTAEHTSMELSEDGKTYSIKSATSKDAVVDVKFTQVAPAVVAGTNGITNYGTDPAKPWGRMKHLFWPRCEVEGTITTKQGAVDLKGKGIFIHALQGMKPHFAASRWNFAYFQGPTHTAIQMEFTTPPTYGSTIVNVGCISRDGSTVFAGTSPNTKVEHNGFKTDKDNDWPEPDAATFTWDGKSKDGKEIHAQLSGSLGPRIDRVDVMGELPGFVKQIATTASGTKPYVYQFGPEAKLKLKVGDEEKEESGRLFMEATFIS